VSTTGFSQPFFEHLFTCDDLYWVIRWTETNLSCNKLSGYFEPEGNKGGALPLETSESPISFEDFEEFPALPDFTIPFLGGILLVEDQVQTQRGKNNLIEIGCFIVVAVSAFLHFCDI
jgi:hypothetical protein